MTDTESDCLNLCDNACSMCGKRGVDSLYCDHCLSCQNACTSEDTSVPNLGTSTNNPIMKYNNDISHLLNDTSDDTSSKKTNKKKIRFDLSNPLFIFLIIIQ